MSFAKNTEFITNNVSTLARTGSLLLDIRRLSCDQPRADTVSSIACVGRGVERTRFRSRLGLAHLERKGEKPQPVVVLKYFALFNVLKIYSWSEKTI